MKFTISNSELQKALQKVTPVIPSRSTLPVLEHIHFKAVNNELHLVSTDQEISAFTSTPATVFLEGEVLIPSKIINDLSKKLGKGDIEVSVNLENYELNIKYATGQFNLKGLSTEEYLPLTQLFATESPEINLLLNTEDTVSATLPAQDFQFLNRNTIFAVSKEEFKLAMTGVLFQFRHNKLNAVSTDSYRLVYLSQQFENSNFKKDFDFIIPSRTLELLKNFNEEVVISPIESKDKVSVIRFKVGQNTLIVSRLIEEKYPPYEQVIPKNNELHAKIDRKQLVEVINRVQVLTDQNTKRVSLLFKDGAISIQGENSDISSSSNETMAYEGNVNDFEIRFNYQYLLDAVEHTADIEEGFIYMTFSDPNKSSLIKPVLESDDQLMLLMPLRVN
jgi:DNA polymerase-3 subunit beta